ncbi:DUF4102 domain-containing protein [Escherichia coli]|nr:DUF4102 domain-containing protein [Escherichia coli]MBB2417236.1 DUF4102 domain-containing protein [Escherichia sp. 11.1596]MBB2421359.1 DUF4102 domain-containing protein [Escherichia sp. 12.2610]MBB2423494.1 DUF4102 domain-containing protein [Escherichia sp. 11.1597]MBB2431714.1 DUF4102 domain-containing protein [Escherichia sp. 11.1600]MDQ9235126.1 DUF4102 domain-containing protein [Escherichia marmotae]
MALTDIKVRAAKPTDKQYKLTDGGGMHLLVHPNISRLTMQKSVWVIFSVYV